MLDIGLILSGILVGIVVAAPIGPVNIICIRRTLKYGPVNAFLSGGGAAVGDGIFAMIAAFGLTAIIDFLRDHGPVLQAIGGIFLIGLGIYTFRSDPPRAEQVPLTFDRTLPGVMASTFVLTITNPATMFGFIVIFGGIGGLVGTDGSYADASAMVLGVFLGSALWWAGVAFAVSLARDWLDDHKLKVANEVSGVLIALFGLVVLGQLVVRQLGIQV